MRWVGGQKMLLFVHVEVGRQSKMVKILSMQFLNVPLHKSLVFLCQNLSYFLEYLVFITLPKILTKCPDFSTLSNFAISLSFLQPFTKLQPNTKIVYIQSKILLLTVGSCNLSKAEENKYSCYKLTIIFPQIDDFFFHIGPLVNFLSL